jgi:molybdate transport system regulatory protein
MINLKVKISLINNKNESFMGIGLVWLLERIKKFRSIRLAAKDMGMSYMKAHGILNRLERNLSQPILIRRRGGYDRGGAKLTDFAEKFIAEYDKHREQVHAYAVKEFSMFLKRLNRLRQPVGLTDKLNRRKN